MTGLDTPAFSAFATASSNVSPTATMRLSSSERATQWLGGAFNNASARACDDAIRRFCAQSAEPAQDAKILCSDDLGRNRVTVHFQRRRLRFLGDDLDLRTQQRVGQREIRGDFDGVLGSLEQRVRDVLIARIQVQKAIDV